MRQSSLWGLAVVVSVAAMIGTCEETQDFQITPEMLGLPDGNRRTAEPNEVRAYPAKPDGKTPDRSKGGPVWIGSKSKPEHKLQDGEVPAFHNALDISSRDEDGKRAPQPFKAGVYGTVVAARPGFIAVQLADGNIIQYLHTSKAFVKPGQNVEPGNWLGVTGDVGTKPGNIHLHIQAVNSDGKVINVDRAFLEGRNEKRDRTIKWVTPKWVDVGPLLLDGVKPKVSPDGVVKADSENRKWYYDENAPKSLAGPGASPLTGKWERKFRQKGQGGEWHDVFIVKPDGTAVRTNTFNSDAGETKSWKVEYKWTYDGKATTFTPVGGDKGSAYDYKFTAIEQDLINGHNLKKSK